MALEDSRELEQWVNAANRTHQEREQERARARQAQAQAPSPSPSLPFAPQLRVETWLEPLPEGGAVEGDVDTLRVFGEHGIGLEKRPWLSTCRSSAEIELMQTLKHALDPHRLLNRGKILS